MKDLDAVKIHFEKYEKIAEESFFAKKGKIVNVVGLSIESAGPDSKLGDVCYIYPEDKTKKPIMAEVVGFKEGKTQLTNAVSVNEDDIKAFKNLNDRNIELEIRKVASDSKSYIMPLIEKM